MAEKYTYDIELDGDSESPRSWDNMETMTLWHSRYTLGDEHNYKSNQCFLLDLSELEDPYEDYYSYALYDNLDESTVEKIWEKIYELYIILPVYIYDHSGITINTTGFRCPWDSGQVGWVYVSKATLRKEYNWERISKAREKQIESYLKAQVETYDQYISGEVYGYIVRDLDGESVDSCWGFYTKELAETEALSAIAYLN